MNFQESTKESGATEKLTYSVTEFATALGIGRNVAYDLVHREGFPVIRVGKRRLIIPRKEALEWLSRNSISGESEVL